MSLNCNFFEIQYENARLGTIGINIRKTQLYVCVCVCVRVCVCGDLERSAGIPEEHATGGRHAHRACPLKGAFKEPRPCGRRPPTSGPGVLSLRYFAFSCIPRKFERFSILDFVCIGCNRIYVHTSRISLYACVDL